MVFSEENETYFYIGVRLPYQFGYNDSDKVLAKCLEISFEKYKEILIDRFNAYLKTVELIYDQYNYKRKFICYPSMQDANNAKDWMESVVLMKKIAE